MTENPGEWADNIAGRVEELLQSGMMNIPCECARCGAEIITHQWADPIDILCTDCCSNHGWMDSLMKDPAKLALMVKMGLVESDHTSLRRSFEANGWRW